ncbi:MAG: DUF2937 family protein [Pseudomonadota bacterium]
MIYRYLTIVLAAIFLLAGLQIPGFISQYSLRTDAHLREVTQNLAGFQAIADRYHGGSLTALIELHQRSTEPTFRAEAQVIERMVNRQRHFLAEQRALSAGLVSSLVHLLLRGDRELLAETTQGYTYTLTLDENTLLCGAATLVAGITIIDLFYLVVRLLFRRLFRASVNTAS